jgi:radical SAM protein with 4Fe4S-binding SPASM domain
MVIDERLKDIFQVLLECGIIFEQDKTSFSYKYIALQLTSGCNLSCVHCCAHQIKTSGTVTTDVVDKIISLNPKTLVLTGGEPLTHPYFWDIVKHIKKHFNNELRLMTNALLINDTNISDLCFYFDYIDISLDGASASDTNRVRGCDVYEHVISAIKLLKKHEQVVDVSAIMECLPEGKTERFYELAESLGVTPTLRTLNVTDRVIENFDKVVIGGGKNYINISIRELNKTILNRVELCSCNMFRYSLFFDAQGNLYPCGGLADEKFIVGNIDNFFDLPDFNTIEQEILKDETFAQCRTCIYRAGCWECFSYVINRAKFPEIFSVFCKNNKIRWSNLLRNYSEKMQMHKL